jgi:hypothetical protein
MRKIVWLVALFLVSTAMAQSQKHTWNLSDDVRATNSQISFNQKANGVWYFMESSSLQHNPQTYRLFPNYTAPCAGNPDDPLIDGTACWRPLDSYIPVVGVNFTDQTLARVPPHSVYAHPAPDTLAIVAWKSPLSAKIKVSGTFTDLNPDCGNGVIWSIEKGTQVVTTQALPNGGIQSFEAPSLAVSKGDVLYFLIDANAGDLFCDATMIDLKIVELRRFH